MNLVALVGMAGSGKSEVADVFCRNGYFKIRFGDITEEEVNRLGWPLNEDSERKVREGFRNKHGMAAFALLNLPKIKHALELGQRVVLDGLYSWEEFLVLKEHFGLGLKVIAVFASPQTRYQRLSKRAHCPLTTTQSISRDKSEIENINKSGPIAMADYTLINEGSLTDLEACTKHLMAKMERDDG